MKKNKIEKELMVALFALLLDIYPLRESIVIMYHFFKEYDVC